MAAEHGGTSRRRLEEQREDALVGLCKQYRSDLKQAQRVRATTAELFKELRKVHGLPPQFEGWLLAAAMLAEIGGFVSRTGRHRHTFYLIAHSEIFGFSPRERRIIATIARFVGSSKVSRTSKLMAKIRAADFERVRKAIVLLRLSRALNQGRRNAVTRVRATLADSTVKLRLATRGSADLELWALSKERSYFREVFGRELAAEVS